MTVAAAPIATSPPTLSPTATLLPAPELIVVMDGVPREMILEWTLDAPGVTRWQYRLRGPIWLSVVPETWGAWTDIPSSDVGTPPAHSPHMYAYWLTGLEDRRGYYVEVRGLDSGGGG